MDNNDGFHAGSQLSVHDFMKRRARNASNGTSECKVDNGNENGNEHIADNVNDNGNDNIAVGTGEERGGTGSPMDVLDRLLNPPRHVVRSSNELHAHACNGEMNDVIGTEKTVHCENNEAVEVLESIPKKVGIDWNAELDVDNSELLDHVFMGNLTTEMTPDHEPFDDHIEDMETGKGKRKRAGGRPKGSKGRKKVKEGEEKRSGPQWKTVEVLALAKGWVLQTQQLVQTEESLWIGIEKVCREKFGLERSRESMRCKWPTLSKDCQLWNSCYQQVLSMNRTGNAQQDQLHKLTHAIYQSRRRREKDSNPGIGITFKYIETAEYLASIPKFGEVDGNGGVLMERTKSYVPMAGTSNDAILGSSAGSIITPGNSLEVGSGTVEEKVVSIPNRIGVGSEGQRPSAILRNVGRNFREVRTGDEETEIGSSVSRPMGIKSLKRNSLKNNIESSTDKSIHLIKTAMDETNRIMKKVSNEQRTAGKVERMYLSLKFMEKGTSAYESVVKKITELSEVVSSDDE